VHKRRAHAGAARERRGYRSRIKVCEARAALDWPNTCKLAHCMHTGGTTAIAYKGLRLAQLLGQLGVFLSTSNSRRSEGPGRTSWSAAQPTGRRPTSGSRWAATAGQARPPARPPTRAAVPSSPRHHSQHLSPWRERVPWALPRQGPASDLGLGRTVALCYRSSTSHAPDSLTYSRYSVPLFPGSDNATGPYSDLPRAPHAPAAGRSSCRGRRPPLHPPPAWRPWW
jgi:hypothetical protein